MTSPLMVQFLAESRELLETVSEQLMGLEREPENAEMLTALFRMVHTLKGNSGLFEIREMTRVLHAGEDLMDAIRIGQLPFTPATADTLLEAMDFVALLCDELEAHGEISATHASTSASLATALRAPLGRATVATAQAGAVPATVESTGSIRGMRRIPADVRDDLLKRLAAGEMLQWVEYTPEAECFFQGEDPLHQVRGISDLIWCDVEAATEWPAPEELNAYHCNLIFRFVTTASMEAIAEHFRYMPDCVTIKPLSDSGLTTADARQDGGGDTRGDITRIRIDDPDLVALIAGQRSMLRHNTAALGLTGRIRAAASTLAACLHSVGDMSADESLDAAEAASLAEGSGDALVAWIERTFLAEGSAALESNGIAVADSGAHPRASDQPHLAPRESAEPKAARKAEEAPPPQRSLKVDQAKIDRLMNLIGEIVVAKNALPFLATRAATVYGSRELSREIKAQHAVINRITEEMQDTIMQVRMMPVSTVFQRFPRLVRDTSRALGKDVHLVLEGEDTDADKNIIESIGDPLIHIVRNSLDHGFETPAERVAAGKAATGTLTIRARQETDRVLIDIIDDGKGIDPAVVRRKAVEKGILDQAGSDRLSDQAAVNLVFAAGFSTKDVVSDLSGRGVGMDVVRTAVEKVNGTVTLESTLGSGTHVRLSLPLSLAVTNVMMVESDGQRFGVPMANVIETVRVPRMNIRSIKTSMTTSLRGRVVPLQSMNTLLSLASPPRPNDHDEYATLVVRSGHESLGLLVDEFCGTTDVILKPMTGVLAGLTAFAGSALMGDGSVLMVLDMKEIL